MRAIRHGFLGLRPFWRLEQKRRVSAPLLPRDILQ
jgi:hypothetical protein